MTEKNIQISDKATTGPEDFPLKNYVKTFPLAISIYEIKTDKLIRTEFIDYSNYEHRKWLGKITFFACSNGYSVETQSLNDYEAT